jgi:hypothetical protein
MVGFSAIITGDGKVTCDRSSVMRVAVGESEG